MYAAPTLTSLVPLLPEIVLGVGAMALLMLGVYRSSERSVVLIDAVSIALLVIAGYYLMTVLREQGKMEDCLMSGRSNCAPLDIPTHK